MNILKQPNEHFKTVLANMIKQREDISDFIKGYDIKGLDLSYSIITNFIRINEDLSNTLFVNSKLGKEGSITNFMGCNLSHCNFSGAIFYGTVWLKRVNARNATFKHATLFNPHVEYSDFRNASLCGALIRLNTQHFIGAKFDETFIKDFANIFNYDITIIPKG